VNDERRLQRKRGLPSSLEKIQTLVGGHGGKSLPRLSICNQIGARSNSGKAGKNNSSVPGGRRKMRIPE